MPRRKTIFLEGEYYHVFNRSAFKQPILTKKNDLNFFHQLVQYYLQEKPPIKFSYYRANPDRYKIDTKRLATIISYCYMPNHFHFTLRQESTKGIQKFMQKILNSFSHYYKLKNNLKGPLFESTFKSVYIESNEQLLHLSRYHHLNPVTAYLVEQPEDYEYSSYRQYMEKNYSLIDPSIVLNQFRSKQEYTKFVINRKDYQRDFDKIKHLILQ